MVNREGNIDVNVLDTDSSSGDKNDQRQSTSVSSKFVFANQPDQKVRNSGGAKKDCGKSDKSSLLVNSVYEEEKFREMNGGSGRKSNSADLQNTAGKSTVTASS